MQKDVFSLLNKISQAMFDKKGNNILALDVRPCHLLTDYVIIAEGGVDKHVIAIADAVRKTMDDEGWSISFVQGMQTGDWVVLDYGQITIHLFVPSVRERYQLERLWHRSEIVDVVIEVPEKRCLII
jgi:ribosome-associated protein